MIDASFGWHAITSRTPKKRTTILALDYAGVLGLVAATVSLEIINVTTVAVLTMMYTDYTYLWLRYW